MTVRDLCAFGKDEFAQVRNVGLGVLVNIEECLHALSPEVAVLFSQGAALPSCAGNQSFGEEQRCHHVGKSLLDMDKLSVRARNALMREGITTVDEVLSLGKEGLGKIRNLGAKTIDEIFALANMQSSESMPLENRNTDCDMAESVVIGDEPNAAPAEDELVEKTKSLIRELSGFVVMTPSFLQQQVKANPNVTAEQIALRVLDSLVVSFLRRHPWGLSLEEFEAAVSGFDGRIAAKELDGSLRRVAELGLAVREQDIWKACEKSIEQAVEDSSVTEPHKRQVYLRLTGKTLDEVGQETGVTRERVRQIVAKADISNVLEGTRAFGYLKLVQSYELNERELCEGLGATKEEWEAVDLVYKQDAQPGAQRRPATDLLSNRHIPQRIRFCLDAAIHYGYVKIDGEYVRKKKLDLCLYVLKKHGSKSAIAGEELIAGYNQLLCELGLSSDGSLALPDRYLNTVAHHKECVLTVFPSKLRYYDCAARDVGYLVDALPFQEYVGKEFSTRVLFRDNQSLMQEFELEDEYELHSLLRYYSELAESQSLEVPYTLTRRMPIIRVGEADRERQVIELAREVSPISKKDFAELYEELYGIEQDSFAANYLGFVSSYTAGPMIVMNLEDFTESEKARMAALFAGDCYELSDIENAYRREFSSGDLSRVNALSVRNLGFKVYSHCVIRDTWPSQFAYFDSVLLGKSVLFESDVPSNLWGIRAFDHYFDMLVRQGRLLPFGGGEWITEGGMRELGIGKDDLLDFAGQVASMCEEYGYSYCNAVLLRNCSFEHELLDYELNDEFYAYALCIEGTRFLPLNCSRKRIACLDGAKTSTAAFVDAQIPEGGSIDVEDLIDEIKERYGIEVRRDKVLSAPERTDLYYSQVTNMIYKTKATFIKEIE